MLALYGHPFSSYSWKALIALYASGTEFAFREVGPDKPTHGAFVQAAHPAGKFPVLVDGEATLIEATAIIEHLAACHPGAAHLVHAPLRIGDLPVAIAQLHRLLALVLDADVIGPDVMALVRRALVVEIGRLDRDADCAGNR